MSLPDGLRCWRESAATSEEECQFFRARVRDESEYFLGSYWLVLDQVGPAFASHPNDMTCPRHAQCAACRFAKSCDTVRMHSAGRAGRAMHTNLRYIRNSKVFWMTAGRLVMTGLGGARRPDPHCRATAEARAACRSSGEGRTLIPCVPARTRAGLGLTSTGVSASHACRVHLPTAARRCQRVDSGNER